METVGELNAQLRASAKPGKLCARYLRAFVAGRGNPDDAIEFAKRQRWIEADRLAPIFKAGVSAMGTGEAISQGAVEQDLVLLTQPLTIPGRLAGFRNVPSGINCVAETAQTAAYWGNGGGEGSAIPMSSAAFTRSMLRAQRVSAASVIDEELARVSRPSAEEVMLRDAVNGLARKINETFVDPANLGSPEEMPASITRSAPQFTSTGTTVAAIDADLRLLLNSLSDGGSDLANAAWIMNPRSAAYLASLRGSGGSPCFPGTTARGGELLGLPVLTSGSIARSGSPEETYLVLCDPSRIWLCDEGRANISISGFADLQMVDNATADSMAPTATTVVSMFQTASLAIKATRWLNWKAVSAASAAAVLTKVNF
jgi:hypothetical protein